MPPADSLSIVTQEEKENEYKKLEETTNKAKGKGPTYILGDWNARMQKQQNKEDAKVFGKWTFEPDKCKVHELSDNVQWNRRRCIQFCQKNNLLLANTIFKKAIEKKRLHTDDLKQSWMNQLHIKTMNTSII